MPILRLMLDLLSREEPFGRDRLRDIARFPVDSDRKAEPDSSSLKSLLDLPLLPLKRTEFKLLVS